MRGRFKAVLAFGLVAALAGPVSAQGRGGWGGPGMLIGNPSVQKELKLDDDQIKKAEALATELREKNQENRSKLEGLEGDELMKKRQEIGRANNEMVMKSVHGFLKPEQVSRFKQIELQQMGANALAIPAIASKLNVTDEQAAQVKTILAEAQTEMTAARQSAGDDRQAAMQKIQGLRKETNTKVMALMTEDQKKTWKEMTGEHFEVVYQPRGQ